MARPEYRGVLVGREHQLAAAVRFADRLDLEGRSGIIRVWAPPGVGKTRLVMEMERRMPLRRFILLRGDPSPGHSVYGTFIEEWFGLSPRMDREWNTGTFGSVWDRLMMDPAAQRGEMQACRPFLENLAGISADPCPSGLEPEQRWERTAASLAALFDLLACISPVAVVMEDLQWFRTDELSVAARVIEGGTSISKLFLLTGRPDAKGSPPDLKVDLPLLASLTLELDGLPEERVPEFLAGLGVAPPGERLLDYLWRTAGGVPLFLQQVMDYLGGAGVLAACGGVTSLSADLDELPSSIGGIFRSRLELLPSTSRKLTAAASVLGPVFPASRLRSMVDECTWNSLTEGEALKGILSPEGDQVRFEHELLREWTAETVPGEELSRLHLIAARVLQEEPGAVASPSWNEMVASHLLLGGDEVRAVRFMEQAAAGYAGEFRNESAASLYRKLIPMLDDPDRARVELDLYEVYKNSGLLRECIGLLTATLERMDRGSAAEKDLSALVELKLGECLGSAGELERAEGMVRRSLKRFSVTGDRENRAVAERQLGMILMSRGMTEEALEVMENSVSLARETGSPRLLCAALYWAAIAFRQVGDHERMEACTREQVRVAEDSGLKKSMTAGYDNLMRIHIYRRDYEAAEEAHRKLREAAEETANWAALSAAASKMGIIHLRRGETERAAGCFRRCVSLSEKTGNERARCAALGNLAQVCIEMKDTSSAMKYSTELIDTSARIGFRSGVMSGYARMGHIFSIMGQHHSALECLETQIEHADALKDSRNLSDGWATAADIQFTLGDMNGALASIRRALDHSRDAADMLLYGSQMAQMGKYMFVLGRGSEARACLEEAMEQNREMQGREHVVFRCGLYLEAVAGRQVLHMLKVGLEPEVEAEVHFCQWKVTGDSGSAMRSRALLEASGVPGTHPMLKALPARRFPAENTPQAH